MFTLPENATKESYQRAQLIYELVKDCPSDIGQEVFLYCSVAKGYADQYSDIELTFLVEELQSTSVYEDWLNAQGFKVDPATINWGGGYSTKSWLKGIFVEAAWRPIRAVLATMTKVRNAETVDHWELVDAWHILHAVPLKGGAQIKAWQNNLAYYPKALQAKLIKDATQHLAEPHWYPLSLINMLPLVTRQIPMHLSGELTWTVERTLRILFAANQVWEPDYKWLKYEAHRLHAKPSQLIERVNNIFMLPDLSKRLLTSFELLLEVLKLIPSDVNISPQTNHVQETLAIANRLLRQRG